MFINIYKNGPDDACVEGMEFADMKEALMEKRRA
jgi:hypothetical protein